MLRHYADVNVSVHVRAEEDPTDGPGEPGENTEGDGDVAVCKRRSYHHIVITQRQTEPTPSLKKTEMLVKSET